LNRAAARVQQGARGGAVIETLVEVLLLRVAALPSLT
jgi:hypothetical protein